MSGASDSSSEMALAGRRQEAPEVWPSVPNAQEGKGERGLGGGSGAPLQRRAEWHVASARDFRRACADQASTLPSRGTSGIVSGLLRGLGPSSWTGWDPRTACKVGNPSSDVKGCSGPEQGAHLFDGCVAPVGKAPRE